MNAMSLKLVVDNGRAPTDMEARRKLLAKVHMGSKALGIEEEDYRALLERLTGHDSAAQCDDRQLQAVITEFGRMGWQSFGGHRKRTPGESQTVRKARAMWISLHQLGAISDGSDAALEAFGRRQLKVDRLQWANERQAYRLIEALKAIADRNGWDQRVPSRLPVADAIRLLKDRLIGAQIARLEAAGVAIDARLAGDRSDWTNKQLERAASALAAKIAALPKGT